MRGNGGPISLDPQTPAYAAPPATLIAYDPADFPWLAEHVTAERVRAHFAGIVAGEVVRYALPQLGALNFILHAALGGGVTRSLALDAHGKGLSSALLDLDLPERAPPD